METWRWQSTIKAKNGTEPARVSQTAVLPLPSPPPEWLGYQLAGEGAPCCGLGTVGTKLLEGGAPDPTLPAAIYQKLKITQE